MAWRSNKKGWINAQFFRERLQWFDAQIEGRRDTLLVDKFSAHRNELEIVKDEGGLLNIEVIFLPINTTSYCQPLGQGINHSWKAHYCHHWVRYKVDKYTANRDPNKTMHMLQASQWGNVAQGKDIGKHNNSHLLATSLGAWTQLMVDD